MVAPGPCGIRGVSIADCHRSLANGCKPLFVTKYVELIHYSFL
jgi:hypothetical protein